MTIFLILAPYAAFALLMLVTSAAASRFTAAAIVLAVIGFALALGWAAWKREVWRPALLIGAMAATFAVSTVIKHQVVRARPPASEFMHGTDDAVSCSAGHHLRHGGRRRSTA